MRTTLPNLLATVLDPQGRFTQPWSRFFGAMVSEPSSAVPQVLTGSPTTLDAPSDGHFVVFNAVATGIWVIRGRDTIGSGVGAGFIPVSRGDKMLIQYGTVPTVVFIPS